MNHKLLSILTGVGFLASASTIAYAQNPNAALTQIDNLAAACAVQQSITPDQFQTESINILTNSYSKGEITPDEYASTLDKINTYKESCSVMQTQMKKVADARDAYDNHQISAKSFRLQCDAAFRTLLDGKYITQDMYTNLINKMDAYIAATSQQQSGSQPVQPTQPVAQNNNYHATGDIQQDLVKLYELCANGSITPEQFMDEYNKMTAELNVPAYADYKKDLDQMMQGLAQECRSTQAQNKQPVQTAPQQATPTQDMYYQQLGAAMMDFSNGKISEHELRTQYASTLDNMVNDGIISSEQRTQIMDNLGSSINQASKYKSFNEEVKALNARFESGKMTSKRWEKEAIALVDKKEKENLLTAQEAEEYRKQIKQRAYDFRHNVTDIHDEARSNTYYSGGYQITNYWTETVYNTDADNHRRPSAFQMQFGPMGGVIFDHQGNWLTGKGSVYENSNSFVSLRQEDEILGYAGLNFELGYTWRRIFSFNWLGIGLFVRQDAACGIWTGDTANTHDPEIIGITTGGLRLEFGFQEGALYWGYDFGVGIAYATGDKRDDRYNSDYRPAYFYDTDFNSSVNLDILLGTYFNYFFADDVGIGFGLYFNFTLKDFENEAGSISHNTIILQPDIHLVIDI